MERHNFWISSAKNEKGDPQDMDYMNKYEIWKEKVTDKALRDELNAMSEKEIVDAFYKDLAFGTGGLRGILGAGTYRMNIYTVAKASQIFGIYPKAGASQIVHYNNPDKVPLAQIRTSE